MSASRPVSDDELAGLFAGLETTPLALAVSGGADSMALMHMVARWAKRPEVANAYAHAWRDALNIQRKTTPARPKRIQWSGLKRPSWLPGDTPALDDLVNGRSVPHVVVMTVDHGLREGSEAETDFVKRQAEQLGLVCEALRWDGDKPVTGIQDAARQARRNLMLDVLRAERGILVEMLGYTTLDRELDRCLVMAHHQEDQAETVLMRLGRGSGLEGLGGMRVRGRAIRGPTPERPEHFTATVLRPLLDLPKARLVATLEHYRAEWVEDPSNEDDRFERVRVRKVLAQLGAAGLNAEKICMSARRLRDTDEALQLRGAFGYYDKTSCVLMPHLGEITTMREWHAAPYLYVRTLRWLVRIYGGGARPAELSQLEELARQLMNSAASIGGGVTLGGCKIELMNTQPDTDACAVQAGHRVRIYREGSGSALPVVPVSPGQTVDWDGARFSIVAQASAQPGAVVRALGMQGWVEAKKLVPGLDEIGLPAAAVATMPVVVDGATGAAISYCGLDAVLEKLQKTDSKMPRGTAVSMSVWQAWHDATTVPGRDYFACYNLFTQHW